MGASVERRQVAPQFGDLPRAGSVSVERTRPNSLGPMIPRSRPNTTIPMDRSMIRASRRNISPRFRPRQSNNYSPNQNADQHGNVNPGRLRLEIAESL